MFATVQRSGVSSLRPATERRLGRSLLAVQAYTAVRTVLAAILIGAAVLKGHQLATEPVLGSGLLSSRVFLITLVELEWLFGVWLVAGMYPKWTWRVAVGCFGLFACVSLYKGLSGDASCGCFGRVTVSPWWTLTMDLAAVAALLLWAPREQAPKGEAAHGVLARRSRLFPLGILLVVVLFAGISGAIAMASFRPAMLADDGVIIGPGNVIVLEPEKWVGKRFPLLPHIQDYPGRLAPGEQPLRERLRQGNWIVVLYHHDCPKCLNEMPKYEQLARLSAADLTAPRVVLIEIPPYGEANSVKLVPNAACVLGRLSDEKEWLVETPAELPLQCMFVDPAGRSDGVMSQQNVHPGSGGIQ
jgi:hypothetical protein